MIKWVHADNENLKREQPKQEKQNKENKQTNKQKSFHWRPVIHRIENKKSQLFATLSSLSATYSLSIYLIFPKPTLQPDSFLLSLFYCFNTIQYNFIVSM